MNEFVTRSNRTRWSFFIRDETNDFEIRVSTHVRRIKSEKGSEVSQKCDHCSNKSNIRLRGISSSLKQFLLRVDAAFLFWDIIAWSEASMQLRGIAAADLSLAHWLRFQPLFVPVSYRRWICISFLPLLSRTHSQEIYVGHGESQPFVSTHVLTLYFNTQYLENVSRRRLETNTYFEYVVYSM